MRDVWAALVMFHSNKPEIYTPTTSRVFCMFSTKAGTDLAVRVVLLIKMWFFERS